VYQITKNKRSEREKMMAIIQLIHKSLEYDYPGAKSDNYANPQNNAKQILAGKNRIAVCAGYAHVFEELCAYANISCRYVLGYAKNNFNKIENKGRYHAWNIATIDGKEELYDITWADGEDDQWLNVNPKLMIYSHFPDNEKDQLLLEPIKYEDFVSATVVFPKSTANQFSNYYPKQAVVFTDSIFSFTIDALVNNISINEISGDYFNVVYVGENKNTNKSYPVTSITNFKLKQQDGKTTVNIPLSQDISAINIYVNGCSYAYKVIKGNQFGMYKSFQKNANKNNLDNYIKGVLASVVLNDAQKLGELVGYDNPLFFDKSNQIKKELVDKFKNWQGSISSWEKEKMTTIRLASDAKGRTKTMNTITENRIYIGTHYVVFDEINNAYAITSLR
jgi:transglutaminase/protease-like cytokinesis protein 3